MAREMFEIERKFLVQNMDWGVAESSRRIEQGYLFIADDRNMRIRRSGDEYTLTLKVAVSERSRHEVELPVDPVKGQAMLDALCVTPAIKKVRHVVVYAGKHWEIDVFEGSNDGLIVAEVELDSENEAFEIPSWAGPEVTQDPRYFNAALTEQPFSAWGMTYEQLVAETKTSRL